MAPIDRRRNTSRCGNGSPRQTGMPMAGSDWSRRTELVLLDHDQAKEADQLGAGDGRGAQYKPSPVQYGGRSNVTICHNPPADCGKHKSSFGEETRL